MGLVRRGYIGGNIIHLIVSIHILHLSINLVELKDKCILSSVLVVNTSHEIELSIEGGVREHETGSVGGTAVVKVIVPHYF